MDPDGSETDLTAAFDSFDISGSSVSALQNFLDWVPDVPLEEALEILRPYCTGLSRELLQSMIVSNKFEVQHVSIACLPDVELKLAIRLFTVNEPFQLFRWFNRPFFDKVCACIQCNRQRAHWGGGGGIHYAFRYRDPNSPAS
jgi:hypothetical protein